MKFTVVLLSIILLWLVGHAGEQFLNLVHDSEVIEAELPAVTAFVIRHFPLNAGHFSLSLTPFMVLLLGAGSASLVRRRPPETFLYLFITIWLLAGIYISLFAAALLLPFHILLVEMRDSPLPAIIIAVDAILIGCFVLCHVRDLRSRRKAEQDAAGNAG